MDQANGPDLGNYGNNSCTPGQRWSRTQALRLREVLWLVSSIADVRKCGRVPVGGLMPVTDTPGGARLGGLCRCHSVWLCPICAPEIRAARGVEIGLAVELHLAGSGGVGFGSLTVPHGVSDRLRDTYSVIAKAWDSVNNARQVKRFRGRHGYWGFVRTVEITLGVNGWHPHIHFLDFWDGALSARESAEYHGLVLAAWQRAVVRLGLRRPSMSRGLVYVPVTDSEVIGDYMTELKPMSAAHELTALSTKQARQSGLTPFDILGRIDGIGSKPWVSFWWEYEEATRGRRMLGASRDLFKRLGIMADDPVPVDAGEVVGFVRSEDWSRLWFAGRLFGAQAAIEAAASRGQVGIDEAMCALLGGLEVVGDELVAHQLQLGPGDDGGMF